MSIDQSKQDLETQESDFQLPRLSSITFNIASGYDQKKSPAQNITQANRFIIHEISQAVAKINRIHFRKKLEPILQEHGDYVKQTQIALIDNYGRATYFYCRLANQIIPIYQPGTIMFESAVKENSKLNVTAHGGQQNGPLLGNGCATFLAKFHCNLIACYQRICAVSYQDCNHFFPNIYKTALKETLFNFGIEDAKEHGRLISMQETLLGLGGDKMKKDDDDLIRLFHIKDISEIEGRSIDQVGAQKDCPLSYFQYKKIANMRQNGMYYSESSGLFKGKCIAEKTLQQYKSGLMVKSGLVPPQNDEMFKLQMVALIKQIQETSQAIKSEVIVKSGNYGASRGLFSMDRDKQIVKEYNQQKTEKQQLSGTASQNSGDLIDPVESTYDDDKQETKSKLSRSSTKSSTLYSLFSESIEDDEDDDLQDQLGRQWLIEAIKKNERIQNYYNALVKDVEQIFTNGQISRVGDFHYSSMKLNDALVQLGHYTPVLGYILHIYGFKINQLQQSTCNYKERLKRICEIIPQNLRKQTAQKIVTDIIIGRRQFLQTLQDKNIRKVIRKLDDWRGKTTNLSKMKNQDIMVEVDSRTIQCIMIGLPIEKFQKMYIDRERMNHLINDVTDSFFNPQPVSTITGNLANDEKPLEFKRGAEQFDLHLDLFQEYKKEIPSYMKRLKNESAVEHQIRCEEFLLNVGQEHFDRLGMICDPNSPRRKNLFLVYSNALKARKKIEQKKKKGKCTIF